MPWLCLTAGACAGIGGGYAAAGCYDGCRTAVNPGECWRQCMADIARDSDWRVRMTEACMVGCAVCIARQMARMMRQYMERMRLEAAIRDLEKMMQSSTGGADNRMDVLMDIIDDLAKRANKSYVGVTAAASQSNRSSGQGESPYAMAANCGGAAALGSFRHGG